VTCGAAPLVACSLDDVVSGLAQVSQQVQGVAAFTMIVLSILTFFVVLLVGITFANHR
jgi:hypothetical protein